MAVRLETALEVAAKAAIRWRDQYRHWGPHDRFSDGVTKEQIDEALNEHRHTPENIAAIINPGWAYPQCGACGERFEAVAVMADAWSDELHTMCRRCVTRAYDLLLGANVSSEPIPNGSRTGSAMFATPTKDTPQ